MEIMDAAPTTEDVYQGVYALYNNPDSAEKEKASKWLDSLQKSVSFTFTKFWFRTKCLPKYHYRVYFGYFLEYICIANRNY